MVVPVPSLDWRLQRRYLNLVQQHLDVCTPLAAGIHSLPQVGDSFAATQAAWRFFANRKVTLPHLVGPLRQAALPALQRSDCPFALVVLDWSKLDYAGHASKTDQVQLSHALDRGYELTTALLVEADRGMPLAPLELSLRAANGCHTTAHSTVQDPVAHLDQVGPVMTASRTWGLSKRLVFVVDREGDSLLHLRQWHQGGHLFLVRGDDRRVTWAEQTLLLTQIVGHLQRHDRFRFAGEVELKGRPGRLFVAETEVLLDGPAWQRDEQGKSYRVAGVALRLRLVVTQVRDEAGAVLASWSLLTNVPHEIAAERIATWYYWRWRIETFHKLIKSAGLQLEQWQQETASAISKRLLVACMACVMVWQLQSQTTPAAKALQSLLMDLSGRQTKRDRPVTTSGLLAGLHTLLVMLGVLERYTPQELREMVETGFAVQSPSG
jgi:hypothetical protein